MYYLITDPTSAFMSLSNIPLPLPQAVARGLWSILRGNASDDTLLVDEDAGPRSYFRRPLSICYTRFFEIPYSLARSGTLTPWAYRSRISELRLCFLRVLGGCAVEGSRVPGYSRSTRKATASSKVKLKLPSALKACGSRSP